MQRGVPPSFHLDFTPAYPFSLSLCIHNALSMSERAPRSCATTIALRIDHGTLDYTNASVLQERIGYPPSTKRYEGHERIRAVLKCLRERVIDDKQLAIFANCLRRDRRVSNRIRKFATHAIFKSMSMTVAKTRKLYDFRYAVEEIQRTAVEFRRNICDATGRQSDRTVRKTLQILEDVMQKLKDRIAETANAIPEWDHFGYGKD